MECPIMTMTKANNLAVLGLGTDIIDISRMRQSIERHGLHFLNRLFTQKEQDYCYRFQDPVPHFAGRFAAKEALVKALGTGFGKQIHWHDLEILSDELGKPIVHSSERLNKEFNTPNLLISISHATDHAVATALWV